MEVVKAKLKISITDLEDNVDTLFYLGNEVIVSDLDQRVFQLNGEQNKITIRINQKKREIIQTYDGHTTTLVFDDTNMGTLIWNDNLGAMEFIIKMLHFSVKKDEIFVHYILFDKKGNKISEHKMNFISGE